MLSWDDFRYVKAIADMRSLAGAAETLGVNHSTVFRRLGQIEQQLGARPFERRRARHRLHAAYPEIVLDIVVSNQRLNLSKRDADVAVRALYQNPDPLAGRKVARIA